MDAFGVEELAPGELDLTPGCIDRAGPRGARAAGGIAGARGMGRRAVALSPERLRGGLAEHAAAGRGRRPPQPLHLRKRGDGRCRELFRVTLAAETRGPFKLLR